MAKMLITESNLIYWIQPRTSASNLESNALAGRESLRLHLNIGDYLDLEVPPDETEYFKGWVNQRNDKVFFGSVIDRIVVLSDFLIGHKQQIKPIGKYLYRSLYLEIRISKIMAALLKSRKNLTRFTYETSAFEGWRLCICRAGISFVRYFPDKKFGSGRKSLAAAEATLVELKALVDGSKRIGGKLTAAIIKKANKLLLNAVP